MTKALKYAAIAGSICVVVFAPLKLYFNILKNNGVLSPHSPLYVSFDIAADVFWIIFIWGFKVVADKYKSNALKITAVLLILYSLVGLILQLGFPALKIGVVSAAVTGIINIFFGLSLLVLGDKIGITPKVAAGIKLFLGFCSLSILLRNIAPGLVVSHAMMLPLIMLGNALLVWFLFQEARTG